MMTSFMRPTIVEPAVASMRGEVAGAEPAVGVNAAACLVGVEVADEQLRAPHEQLAVGRDAELDRADGATVGVARASARIASRARRDRRRLGRAVACASRARRAVAVASSTNAALTPAPPLETSRSDATRSGVKPGRVHQPDEERGRPDHERDALASR